MITQYMNLVLIATVVLTKPIIYTKQKAEKNSFFIKMKLIYRT